MTELKSIVANSVPVVRMHSSTSLPERTNSSVDRTANNESGRDVEGGEERPELAQFVAVNLEFLALEVEHDCGDDEETKGDDLSKQASNEDSSTGFDGVSADIVTRNQADTARLCDHTGDIDEDEELGDDGVRHKGCFWADKSHPGCNMGLASRPTANGGCSHSANNHVVLSGKERRRDHDGGLGNHI